MKLPLIKAAMLLVAVVVMYGGWAGQQKAEAALQTATVSGTASSLSGTSAPTTLFLTIGKNIYTINIARTTKIYLKGGRLSSLQQISNGDALKVIGKRRSATVIDAQSIRFTSWNGGSVVRTGTVVEKNCSNNYVVIRYRSQRIHISFPTNPVIIRLGSRIRCQDIQTGETLQVFGSWIPGALLSSRVITFGETVTATVKSVSINAADKTATLNVLIKNKTVKALISPQTQLVTKTSTTLPLANIDVGHTLRVRGIRTIRGTLLLSYVRDASVSALAKGRVVGRTSLPRTLTASSLRAQAGVVGRVAVPGWGNSLKVAGSYALIADPNLGLIIVNIQDRAHPQVVGSYSNGKHISALASAYPWVYLGDEDGLTVIDITDPAHPVVLGTAAFSRRSDDGFPLLPSDIQAWGQILVMNGPGGGAAVFDVNDPEHPVYKYRFPSDGSTMWLDANGRLHVFGQSDVYLTPYTGKNGHWTMNLPMDGSAPTAEAYEETFQQLSHIPTMEWVQDNSDLEYWALGGWSDWGLYSFGLTPGSQLLKKDALALEINRLSVDHYLGSGGGIYPFDRRAMAISGISDRQPKVLNIDYTDPDHLKVAAEVSDPDFATKLNGNGDNGVQIGSIYQIARGTAVVLRPIDISSEDLKTVYYPAELFVVQFDKAE